jgi:hypothetical protein
MYFDFPYTKSKYFKEDLNRRVNISCEIWSYRRGDSLDPNYCAMVDICVSDIEPSVATATIFYCLFVISFPPHLPSFVRSSVKFQILILHTLLQTTLLI